MFNYTIIIPHKNTPKYLQRCLDSIPERNDIQVIVVDDNSDNLDTINFPGLYKKNTEVYFTNEGKGAGYARNIGLSYAKGKWLLFADADDYFNLDFLTFTDEYLDSDNEIIYFSASSIDIDTGKRSNRNKILVKSINEYKEGCTKSKDNLLFKNWMPWSKMFKHDFIKKNNLKFEEVKVGNDALFVINAGILADKICVDINSIYCVTYNKKSLSFNFNQNLFDERFMSKIRINNYLTKLNKKKYKLLLGPDIVESYNYGIKKTLEVIKIAKKNNNKVFLTSIRSIIGKLLRSFKLIN
ncbi:MULTISPECIES: glycosyltransferase family 2 protein [unclassified Apibacter]|uniref:glycosyltransferase family 2 protein n=1 Tax=unclassified Apibacter TaxID=2630820 RepID=UPI001C872243|nr:MULTISPECIES: glycosyltransferase family A protein [unclassified Apibacter]